MEIEEIELQDLSGNTAPANRNSEEEERLLKKTRLFGIIIASVTAAQAVIFIIIAVLALSCVLGKCGSGALAAGFDSMYTDLGKSSLSILQSSVVFTVLVIIYLILCITWLESSCRVISELKLFFNNYKRIKAAAKFWSVITLIICLFDSVLFTIFLVDAVQGHGSVNIRSVDTRVAETRATGCKFITNVDLATSVSIIQQDDKVLKIKCARGPIKGPDTLKCVNGHWDPDLVIKAIECARSQTNFKQCKDDVTVPSFCKFLRTTDGKERGSLTYLDCKCSFPDVFEGCMVAICSGAEPDWIWRKKPNCVRASPPSSTGTSSKNGGSGNLSDPPLVCLVVALKGFVFWILNVVMLIYFVNIMKNLTGTNCPCHR